MRALLLMVLALLSFGVTPAKAVDVVTRCGASTGYT